MIAITIAALGIAITALGLATWATVQAIQAERGRSDSKVSEEKALGRTELANLAELQARKEAQQAANVAAAERARGDFYERELRDAESNRVLLGDPVHNAVERVRRGVERITEAARGASGTGDRDTEGGVPDEPSSRPE